MNNMDSCWEVNFLALGVLDKNQKIEIIFVKKPNTKIIKEIIPSCDCSDNSLYIENNITYFKIKYKTPREFPLHLLEINVKVYNIHKSFDVVYDDDSRETLEFTCSILS